MIQHCFILEEATERQRFAPIYYPLKTWREINIPNSIHSKIFDCRFINKYVVLFLPPKKTTTSPRHLVISNHLKNMTERKCSHTKRGPPLTLSLPRNEFFKEIHHIWYELTISSVRRNVRSLPYPNHCKKITLLRVMPTMTFQNNRIRFYVRLIAPV